MVFRIHVHIDTSTPYFTFAFAFVILKVINSEILLFRFALISMSMIIHACNDFGKDGIVVSVSLTITQWHT